MLQCLASADAPTRSALIELADSFAVPADTRSVLAAAFAWYYVPLAPDRKAYAERVIAQVLATYDETNVESLPDWFWRVHALRVAGAAIGAESIAPPPDPR